MPSGVGAGQKKGRAELSPYSAAHSMRLIPFFSVVAASLDNRDWSVWPPSHGPLCRMLWVRSLHHHLYRWPNLGSSCFFPFPSLMRGSLPYIHLLLGSPHPVFQLTWGMMNDRRAQVALPKEFSQSTGNVCIPVTPEGLQTPIPCLFLPTPTASGTLLAHG